MKNIKLAVIYFLLAYLIATVVGFSTYYIHETVMWISLFTIMPVVFGYFFYLYLKNSKCDYDSTFNETNLLIIFWIIASFLLDAIVYIILVPIVYGYQSNWTFFIDQSPWIWMNYGTIFLLGHISGWIYKRKINNQVTNDGTQ